MAKSRLKEFGYSYEEILLDDDEERKQFYEKCSKETGKNIQSVPQIYIDELHLGGWSELKEKLVFTFSHDTLQKVTEIVTENLNHIIDCNFYPTTKTYKSNMNHRPIGIGVQGLADTFAKMGMSFDLSLIHI